MAQLAILSVLVLALFIFYGVWSCTRLLRIRHASEKILHQIEERLRIRQNLVTNLLERPEECRLSAAEKQKLQEVCQQAGSAKGLHEKSSCEHLLGVTVQSLLGQNASGENSCWKEFREKFEAVNDEMEGAKRQYNQFARMFNGNAEHFPANLIARMVGLKEMVFLNLP